MHAIVQREFGGPEVLVYEELPDLAPQAGQVRIAVSASGVHLLDTSIRSGTSFGAMPRPELPMVPGREVAGVVDRVGPGVDAQWLGKRVAVHLGMASGGYADQALAAVDSLHELTAGLGFDAAVAAIGTGRTAAGILDQLTLGAEDTVLIPSAAGGLGILLVQAARNAGATVIGLAGGPAKAAHALKAGAGVVIDYRVRGWQQQLRKLGRPTVVYDGVGGEVGGSPLSCSPMAEPNWCSAGHRGRKTATGTRANTRSRCWGRPLQHAQEGCAPWKRKRWNARRTAHASR